MGHSRLSLFRRPQDGQSKELPRDVIKMSAERWKHTYLDIISRLGDRDRIGRCVPLFADAVQDAAVSVLTPILRRAR